MSPQAQDLGWPPILPALRLAAVLSLGTVYLAHGLDTGSVGTLAVGLLWTLCFSDIWTLATSTSPDFNSRRHSNMNLAHTVIVGLQVIARRLYAQAASLRKTSRIVFRVVRGTYRALSAAICFLRWSLEVAYRCGAEFFATVRDIVNTVDLILTAVAEVLVVLVEGAICIYKTIGWSTRILTCTLLRVGRAIPVLVASASRLSTSGATRIVESVIWILATSRVHVGVLGVYMDLAAPIVWSWSIQCLSDCFSCVSLFVDTLDDFLKAYVSKIESARGTSQEEDGFEAVLALQQLESIMVHNAVPLPVIKVATTPCLQSVAMLSVQCAISHIYQPTSLPSEDSEQYECFDHGDFTYDPVDYMEASDFTGSHAVGTLIMELHEFECTVVYDDEACTVTTYVYGRLSFKVVYGEECPSAFEDVHDHAPCTSSDDLDDTCCDAWISTVKHSGLLCITSTGSTTTVKSSPARVEYSTSTVVAVPTRPLCITWHDEATPFAASTTTVKSSPTRIEYLTSIVVDVATPTLCIAWHGEANFDVATPTLMSVSKMSTPVDITSQRVRPMLYLTWYEDSDYKATSVTSPVCITGHEHDTTFDSTDDLDAYDDSFSVLEDPDATLCEDSTSEVLCKPESPGSCDDVASTLKHAVPESTAPPCQDRVAEQIYKILCEDQSRLDSSASLRSFAALLRLRVANGAIAAPIEDFSDRSATDNAATSRPASDASTPISALQPKKKSRRRRGRGGKGLAAKLAASSTPPAELYPSSTSLPAAYSSSAPAPTQTQAADEAKSSPASTPETSSCVPTLPHESVDKDDVLLGGADDDTPPTTAEPPAPRRPRMSRNARVRAKNAAAKRNTATQALVEKLRRAPTEEEIQEKLEEMKKAHNWATRMNHARTASRKAVVAITARQAFYVAVVEAAARRIARLNDTE
ncbi:hypothetical protein C8Q80DRAFT_914353 [Daedaleopsis nitida]|nr:hypothetical protein C8Q80DRAFT_914353 [Daedaleopsis nitida]